MTKTMDRYYDFQVYTPNEVDAVLNHISNFLSLFPDDEDDALTPENFIFRSVDGRYWIVDPIRKNWFSFTDSRWQAAKKPSQALEGYSHLNYYSPKPKPLKSDGDQPPGREPANTEFLTATEAGNILRRSTARALQLYRSGQLTSQSVEILLIQLFLPDNTGVFWTMGCHTGNWYCFKEGAWKGIDNGPDTLLLPASPDFPGAGLKADEPVLPSFLPEPVCPLWSPPVSIPLEITAPLSTCKACGWALPKKAQFCPQCGTPPQAENIPLTCSTCGAKISHRTRFCISCGSAVAQQSKPKGETVDTICIHCNGTIKADQKFCVQCGEKRPEHNTNSKVCTTCGHEGRPDEKFCTGCGSQL